MTTAGPDSPAPRFTTTDAFVRGLVEFINHELPRLHQKVPEHPNVNADTPLFETGVIDSMAILHLIAFVEHAAGTTIPLQQVVMKNFRTARTIAGAFGPGGEAPTS